MHSCLQDKEALPQDVPWGIIGIKGQDEDYETPMAPITMLRNALGREEGGSGVPVDKDAYARYAHDTQCLAIDHVLTGVDHRSVEYWQHHAIIQ